MSCVDPTDENDEPTTYHDDPQNFGIAYMRHAVLLIVGLLSGVILSITAMRVLNARKDAYPEALMNVLKHELVAARRAATKPGLQRKRKCPRQADPALATSSPRCPTKADRRVPTSTSASCTTRPSPRRQSDCTQRKQA
ncbi:MAG: hypothetical protein IPH43_03625 [Xanthomonadales bacterium]|nr:hypothetical protein [Xanthomonadales bacterium]